MRSHTVAAHAHAVTSVRLGTHKKKISFARGEARTTITASEAGMQLDLCAGLALVDFLHAKGDDHVRAEAANFFILAETSWNKSAVLRIDKIPPNLNFDWRAFKNYG